MARTPMVTRTIKTTEVNVLCMDIEAGEPFNEVVVLPRTYKDEKALMKAVSAKVNTKEIKAVHIVETKVSENIYGMTEEAFISGAEIMPERNATKNETDKENESEEN